MSILGHALVGELVAAVRADPSLAAALADALAPYLPRSDNGGGWLTTKDAAVYVGVTVEALDKAARAGRIAYEQPSGVGGKRYFRREALDAWLGGAATSLPSPRNAPSHAASRPGATRSNNAQ